MYKHIHSAKKDNAVIKAAIKPFLYLARNSLKVILGFLSISGSGSDLGKSSSMSVDLSASVSIEKSKSSSESKSFTASDRRASFGASFASMASSVTLSETVSSEISAVSVSDSDTASIVPLSIASCIFESAIS